MGRREKERERKRERKRIDRVCRLGLVNFYVHVAGKQPRITRLLISWFELKAGEATGEPAVGLCEGPRERPFGPLCIAEPHRTSHSSDRLFTIGNLPFYSSSAFFFLPPRSPPFVSSVFWSFFLFSLCIFSLSFWYFYLFVFSYRIRFQLDLQFWIFID